MNKKNKFFLLLIIIIGGLLRFLNLNTRPFDGDEGIIVLIANNSWHDLIARASLDVHPPLYHLLLKLFIYFGINEFSVRLLSVLSGIVLIYLIFIFSRKIFSFLTEEKAEQYALIVSGLAAISPYLLYPSQEARMYALFAVFALLSYYAFYLLINQKIKIQYIILYIVASTATFYTQYLGFIVVASQLMYLLFFRRDVSKQFKIWLCSYVAMFVLFIPQLFTAIGQFSARTSEQTQTGNYMANIKGIFGAFYRFGAGRLFLDVNPAGIKNLLLSSPWEFILFCFSLIIPIVLFVYGLLALYKKNKQVCYFLVFPIVIAIILAFFSSEIGSRASRYFIYLYPMYLIFVTYGAIRLWQGYKKIIPIMFIIIAIAGVYVHYTRDLKAPGSDTIANYIYQNYQDGETVLVRGGFGGGEKWALEYYLQKKSVINKEISIFDMFEDYTPGNLDKLKAIKPDDAIAKLMQNYQKVYFYDMTYATEKITNAKETILGYDKEGQAVTIWEVNK